MSWNRGLNHGLWVISLEDSSEKFLKIEAKPYDWSSDGRWVYAYDKSGKIEYLMIEVESGRSMPLSTIPFTIEGKTYHKIDNKPEIFVDYKTQSDVWVIENFDQIIK